MTLSLKLFLTLFCTMLTGTQATTWNNLEGQHVWGLTGRSGGIYVTSTQLGAHMVAMEWLRQPPADGGLIGYLNYPEHTIGVNLMPIPQTNNDYAYKLATSVGDYFIIDAANNIVCYGQKNSTNTEAPNGDDWDATQVEAGTDGFQFQVTWTHTDGRTTVQQMNPSHLSDGGVLPPDTMWVQWSYVIDDEYFTPPTQILRENVPITALLSWNTIQVIPSEGGGGGYEFLWLSDDDYDVWQVDASGHFVSSIKANRGEDETKFGSDINGMVITGLRKISDGVISLNVGSNTFFGAPQYYIVDGSNYPIGLTYYGAVVKHPSVDGWSAIQVEKPGDHYEVLRRNSSDYDVWQVDAIGNFVRSIKAKLWEDETKFGLDINGDGDTGFRQIQPGVISLNVGSNTFFGAPQYYIVDGSNYPIGLQEVSPQSGADWEAIKVISSPFGGYEVLWSKSAGGVLFGAGDYDVYQFNSEGNFVSSIKANLWEDELKFGLDICDDSSCTFCNQLKIKYNSNDCPEACGSKSPLCEGYKTSYDNNDCYVFIWAE